MFSFTKKPTYSSADIELHLSQIQLDDGADQPASSATHAAQAENLEALVPLIRSLQETGTEQLYLRKLDLFVEEKEREIEQICNENYEDFATSVPTLLSVRQGTAQLKRRIGELDGQMGQVGRSLTEKKRELLQQRTIARNVDEAIETLQTALRLLDLVSRVREMIASGKYFAALRGLEDLQTLPPSSISHTPFYDHILSSVPSLRSSIKSAVTASQKQWLLEMRERSGIVGKLATEHMEQRTRKWKQRRDRDPGMKSMQVGSAVEMVHNERVEFDPTANETIQLDYKPLLQCIHIHDALDSRSELQRSYQEDRKGQASLILSQRSIGSSNSLPATFPLLLQELVGFFIIEQRVLRITRDFRSQQEVDDLWEEVSRSVVQLVSDGLRTCEDPEVFLQSKYQVLLFEQTLETYGFEVSALTSLLLKLFERYSNLLERKYSTEFDQIVAEDDNQPMMVNDQTEFDQVVSACWLATGEAEQIALHGFPQALPFSQTFPMCCINIRNFIDQFYQFVEDVPQRHRDVDELLRKSLDGLLISHISKNICHRLNQMSNLSQIAQVVVNLEHFAIACDELASTLGSVRGQTATQTGILNLQCGQAFRTALDIAQTRIDAVIASKLDDFFEIAEYDWTPPMPVRRRAVVSGAQSGAAGGAQRQSTTMAWFDDQEAKDPSMYLFEMITFLTAYVDSVLISLNEGIKVKTYRAALEHVNQGLLNFLIGPDVPKLNEQALKNLVDDVTFIEKEVKRLERQGLDDVFDEIKSSINLILSEAVSAYLEPAVRQVSYPRVRPRNLRIILEKLSRWCPDPRAMTAADAERMTRRRREAEMIARLA